MNFRPSQRRPWTLGYVSVVMLLFVTITNFAWGAVEAHVGVPKNDAVLSPTRHSTPQAAEKTQQSVGLGTAAISSVTEALFPILPFAGGLDLRRKELWDTSNGWFNTISSMVGQVQVAFGIATTSDIYAEIPRGGEQLKNGHAKSSLKASARRSKSRSKHSFALSASAPFVPIETIATMTLTDLTKAFEYAIGSGRDGFHEKNFFNSLEPRMKPILAAMGSAVAVSRGKDILPAQTKNKVSSVLEYGDIDALQFCAAMRLFAEWRVVRQVPDGYKGYAVGMNLGQKDIVQNVAKIEKAVHEWLDHQREAIHGAPTTSSVIDLRSPTLRDLLSYEAALGTHPNLPRLKDRTGAMGLLWVRRQLHYQTSLFANILEVPSAFPTTNAAVSDAYREVYGKFHGWAVQKIFNYSFQAAPEVEEIYKFMNPHHLKVAHEGARKVLMEQRMKGHSESSLDTKSAEESLLVDEKGHNLLEQLGQHWNNIVGHWQNEWERLASAIGGIFQKDERAPSSISGESSFSASSGMIDGDDVEALVVTEMSKDAHERIRGYLSVVNPLLEDLAGLFDDFNMDDPTKV